MPFLELNQRMPELNGIEVLLTMCFPENDNATYKKRKVYLMRFSCSIIPEIINLQPCSLKDNALRSGFDFLNIAPDYNSIKEDVTKQVKSGCMAGDTLHYGLCLVNDQIKGKGIKAAKELVAARHCYSRSPQAWSKFKNVSHLWCAYRDWTGDTKEEIEESTLTPFLLSENLPKFLALAEQYRFLAEHPSNGSQCKLDPRETWKVPFEYTLPDIQMTLPSYPWEKIMPN